MSVTQPSLGVGPGGPVGVDVAPQFVGLLKQERGEHIEIALARLRNLSGAAVQVSQCLSAGCTSLG